MALKQSDILYLWPGKLLRRDTLHPVTCWLCHKKIPYIRLRETLWLLYAGSDLPTKKAKENTCSFFITLLAADNK